ncbi:MAG: phosphotransferase [Paracoccaceae bacterium]
MVRAGMGRVRNADGFLRSSGWGDARRTPLAGDASARRYERLALGDKTAILMDAPPEQADDIADFVKIDRHLHSIGLSAPKLLAENMAQGFLLLEDFGDGVFARLAKAEPTREPQLYEAATDVLLHLQSQPPAPGLPNLTALEWARAADLAVEWYRFAITGNRSGGAELVGALHEALAKWADGPRVMVLRDYHAENLMFLSDRTGVKSVGLLDFQLAQLGQPGYDMVSLLQDARRDVTPEVEHQMIRRFLAGCGMDEVAFRSAYAALGAQRALRILGIFARLCLRDSKAGYVALMPRVWSQLQRNLAHPALTRLAKVSADLIPEPTPHLNWIEGQCGNFR